MSDKHINGGGPAFPVTDAPTTHRIGVMAIEGITDSEERDRIYTAATVRSAQGMTLRDYFAAKAMQGLLAAQIHGFTDRPANGPFASMAYEMADAMLKERENKS